LRDHLATTWRADTAKGVAERVGEGGERVGEGGEGAKGVGEGGEGVGEATSAGMARSLATGVSCE